MPPNLGQIMKDAVRDHPDRLAVMELGPDGGGAPVAALTYGRLDRELDRIGAGALAAGLSPGDRVGVALRNRLEFALAVFGLMRAGIVPAVFNPRLKADDFAFLLRDTEASAVIADEVSAAAMAEACAASGAPRAYLVGAEARGFEPFGALAGEGPAPRFIAGPDDPALMIYTSGSTGRPKGVIGTHLGQIEHFYDQRAFYGAMYTKPSVNLIAAPLFHKNGTGNLKTAFAMGGAAAIMPRFDARALLRAIPAHGVTTFTAVATMLMMMLKEEALLRDLDFSSLDSIMVGAAPTGRVLLDRVEEIFGARVFHMFGTTESGAVFGHDPKRRFTLDSCGKELPGVSVKLIDETGEESTEGELLVRSPGLAAGYRNRPEETAKRFRDGWYATGDILRRDESGYFFFRGRVDDMFVCGGENIYPMEVERILLLHPAIKNACVAPVPHPTKTHAPAAVIVSADPNLTEADVKTYFVENGPAYAHPRFVLFESDLPIAATGKIDRKAVQAKLIAAAPESLGGEG